MSDPAAPRVHRCEPFHVLMVCRENVCRSRMAEQLARAALDERLGPRCAASVTLSSAGLRATPGTSAHPLTLQGLRLVGLRPVDGPSVQLSADQVAAADLILTATRRQRSALTSENPTATRSTFTITQFARLARAGAAEHTGALQSGHDLIAAAQAGRQGAQPPGQLDDVEDPAGGTPEDFAVTARAIRSAIDQIVSLLEPPTDAPRRDSRSGDSASGPPPIPEWAQPAQVEGRRFEG